MARPIKKAGAPTTIDAASVSITDSDQPILQALADEELVRGFIDGWKRNVASTARPTESDLKERVSRLYELLELPVPEVVVCESPYACWDVTPDEVLTPILEWAPVGPVIDKTKQLWARIESRIWRDCYQALNASGSNLPHDFHIAHLPEANYHETPLVRALYDHVRGPMEAHHNCMRAMWRSFIYQTDESEKHQIWVSTAWGWEAIYPGPFCDLLGGGNADLMVFDFLARLGPADCHAIRVWRELVTGGVWDAILTENRAVICRPPLEMHFDSSGQIHNDTGPAVRWGDGIEDPFLGGIDCLMADILTPESITIERIVKEENVELRRRLIQRIGWERFTAMAGCKVIATDRDREKMERRLIRLRRKVDGECPVLLEVTCPSTHRKHYLRVPPHISDCESAVAWSFGFDDPADYRPLLET
ncbi:hypothetical protein IV102_26480 [bacterium]|nr:hypothetical protein [bacterium]